MIMYYMICLPSNTILYVVVIATTIIIIDHKAAMILNFGLPSRYDLMMYHYTVGYPEAMIVCFDGELTFSG